MKKLSITAALLAAITMVQADIQPEKVLSENTLLVGTIRNVQKTGADIMSTPFGKLINDPATAPIREYIKGELTTSTLDLQTALTEASKTIANCKDVFNGGIAFAVTQPQFKLSNTQNCDVKFIPLLLAETSDKVSIEEKSKMVQAKLSVLLEQLAVKVLEQDASTIKISNSTKEIDSVKLNVITLSSSGCPDSVNFVFAFSDKLFAVSLTINTDANKWKLIDTQQVEKEIANIVNGKVEGTILADSTNYKNVKIAENNNYFYLNLDPLTALAKDYVALKDANYKAPENPMEAMMALPRPLAIFNSLGITAAKSLALNSYVIDGESYTDTVFYCPKTERRGLTALMDCYVKGDCSPIAEISDTVVSFNRVRFDPIKLWETVDGTTAEVLGGIKLMLMAGVENALNQNKDINLKKDVLDNLTGDLIALNTCTDISTNTMQGFDGASIFLFGAKSPENIISSINNCCKTFNPDRALQEFECEGKKVYKLSFGTEVNSESSNVNLNGDICLATIEGYVVMTPGETYLKNFLSAGKENSLAKNAVFVKNIVKIGGTEQCNLSYTDIKAIFPIIRGAFSGFTDSMDEKAKKIYDLLPKLEDVEKYLGTQYQIINIDDNGMTIKSFTPWPEGLEK